MLCVYFICRTLCFVYVLNVTEINTECWLCLRNSVISLASGCGQTHCVNTRRWFLLCPASAFDRQETVTCISNVHSSWWKQHPLLIRWLVFFSAVDTDAPSLKSQLVNQEMMRFSGWFLHRDVCNATVGLFCTVLYGNLGISKNKGTFLCNLVSKTLNIASFFAFLPLHIHHRMLAA